MIAVGCIKYRVAQSNSEVCLHTKGGGYMKKNKHAVLLQDIGVMVLLVIVCLFYFFVLHTIIILRSQIPTES